MWLLQKRKSRERECQAGSKRNTYTLTGGQTRQLLMNSHASIIRPASIYSKHACTTRQWQNQDLSSTVMRSWEQRDDGGPWKWREVEDRSVARSFMLMHAPVTYVRTATHPCQLRLQRAYDPPLTCGRSVSESMLAMAMHALHGSESRASP